MVNQKKLDIAYMNCAYAIAALSNAVRKQVGAVLVSPKGGIIAEGVNGTPSGFDNCCENKVCMIDGPPSNVLVTKPEVLHAESNAIAKVARSTSSSDGCTMYTTYSPCFECAKLMIQAGIVRVVYDEEYRLTDGIDLLRKAKIQVDKL